MLVDIALSGVCVLITGCLLALELALENARPSLLTGWSTNDRGHSVSGLVRVGDYQVASRVVGAVLSGIAVTKWWRVWMESIIPSVIGSISTPSWVGALTGLPVLCAVIGVVYVVAKQVSESFPNQTVLVLSPAGQRLTRVCAPLLFLSRVATRLIVAAPREEEELGEEIEEDIRTLVEEGEKAGVIEEEEKAIISRVFKLGDKPVPSLMTPRNDVTFLSTETTAKDALAVAIESRFTWFPVVGESNDEVLGIVSVHDLLNISENSASFPGGLRDVLTAPLEVPESMTALELLELFREAGSHFAVVRDEYGSLAGIATIDDVLRVIVGEVGEAGDEAREIVRREDGSLLVDAGVDVQNLFERIGVKPDGNYTQGQFHSVGGFIMTHLGHIPREGDHFVFDDYRFEVVDMDGNRIDKVLVSRSVTDRAVGS